MLNEAFDAIESVLEGLDVGGEQSRQFAEEIKLLRQVIGYPEAMSENSAESQRRRMPKQIWVAAVTHKGSVIHAAAVSDKVKAVKALAAYFRTQEGYRGPAELPGLCTWMAEHDPCLGIELFPSTLDLG